MSEPEQVSPGKVVTSNQADDLGRIRHGQLVSALGALESLHHSAPRTNGRFLETAQRLSALLQGDLPGLPGVTAAARELQTSLHDGRDVPARLDALCEAIREALATDPSGAQRERILVVEDDPDMCDVIAESLETSGWEILTAPDLTAARRILDAEPVSLVTLDLWLPDGDGRDVLSRLRSRPRTADLPVLVISAMSDELTVMEALALGADAYVPKPFDPRLLKATAARLLSIQARRRRESRVDALTGAANRAALAETFEQLQGLASRAGEQLTLAIADLNRFKEINDTHGHVVGDAVLVWFAGRLRSAMRSTDYLARWGGDEFVLLLPDTSAREARRVLERCLAAVASQPYTTRDGTALHVQFSAGAVAVRPEETLEETLGRADRRLYRMKDTGRFQRVVL